MHSLFNDHLHPVIWNGGRTFKRVLEWNSRKGAMGWPLCYRFRKKQLCSCTVFWKEAAIKVRQGFSDELRNQKRKVRDKHIGVLGYHCLLTRHVAHTEEQRSAKTREVMKIKLLLRKRPDGTWDLKCWRRISVFPLFEAGLESSLFSFMTFWRPLMLFLFLVRWLLSTCFMSTRGVYPTLSIRHRARRHT